MTGERDELPEGWKLTRDESARLAKALLEPPEPSVRMKAAAARYKSMSWRIVDAEREASDGR